MEQNPATQTRRPGTGYINQSGQLIVVLPEDSVTQGFSERLLLVKLRAGEELLGPDKRLLVRATEPYENYFVDLNGELAFRGRFFTDAKSFSEGLAAVRLEGYTYTYGGPYGYIDHNGYLAIQPQFKQAENFSEGLAAVELPFETGDVFERYWGYIDRKGEMVIPAKFGTAKPFSAGLAVVSVNHKYGYIDHSGKLVIEPQFDDARDFVHGREVAVVQVDDYYGCIDRTGKFVIEPYFDRIDDFYNKRRLAFARVGATRTKDSPYSLVDLEGGQYTFINSAGQPISSSISEYEADLEYYISGSGIVSVQVEGKWGCLDETGTYIISPQFELLRSEIDGLIPFKQNGLWGLLNHQSEIVIPPKFDNFSIFDGFGCSYFNEGLAGVCLNGHWGFIDLAGEFEITAEFEGAHNFSEGLAGVKVNDRWGFIDRSGQIVIPCMFVAVGEFKSGLAMAWIEGDKCSFINRAGEWLVSPNEFDGCSEFEDGAAEIYFK
jgi:WG containing repeat